MDTPSLLDALRTAGEHLPESLRSRFLAAGDAIVPALTDALLAGEDEDDDDWSSIHAVDLLVDLEATSAIEPLLRVLAETEWDHIIHNRIIVRLPALGVPVFEPAMALLLSSPPEDLSDALLEIVAKLGVRDERVYERLVAHFEENPTIGSGALADYGDPRGLPLLLERIENEIPDPDDPFGAHPLIDCVEAYEDLGGVLPEELRERVDARLALFRAHRAREQERERERAASQTPVTLGGKIGRNDPCPCGSGKKYKRCHLGAE